mmetsp:Transcript_109448/g.349215  ORF Transcript_109448/g.349215 Transcript_109448/m.349215 type:complete len:224 (+) Transcript_109448:1496-2167(+)
MDLMEACRRKLETPPVVRSGMVYPRLRARTEGSAGRPACVSRRASCGDECCGNSGRGPSPSRPTPAAAAAASAAAAARGGAGMDQPAAKVPDQPLWAIRNLILTVQKFKAQGVVQNSIKEDLAKHLKQVLSLMEIAWAYPEEMARDKIFGKALDALEHRVQRVAEDLSQLSLGWFASIFCCVQRTDFAALATHSDYIARWANKWKPKMERLLMRRLSASLQSR